MSAAQPQPPGRAADRKLRVLVVDDHDVVHWGFRVLLGEQPWVERCLAARTGAEALRLLPTLRPDVALVDLFLAGESGADVCDSIRKASPSTRVLLISGAGRMSPAAARAAGASGFVSKDWDAREVARAVRMVGNGMTVFEPTAEQPAPMLSEREREVLDLIAAGSTNREIAEQLFLSPHTVKEHTSAVYRKLGARNRAEAVQRAQRVGLLSVSRRRMVNLGLSAQISIRVVESQPTGCPLATSSTSMLPRVALEYGHTAWAAATISLARSASAMSGSVTSSLTATL